MIQHDFFKTIATSQNNNPYNPMDSKLQKIQSMAQNGQFKQAGRHIEKYCRSHAKNTAAWYLNAQLALQQKKYSLAIKALQRVTALNPRHIEAHINLAGLHAKNKEYTQALQHYRQAEILQPNVYALHFNRGKLYRHLDQSYKATLDFQKCLELNPQELSAAIELIELYGLTQQYALAEKLIEPLLGIANLPPPFIQSALSIYIALQRPQTLASLLQNLLQHPHPSLNVLFDAGVALHTHYKNLAFECFFHLTQKHPTHAMAWFNCGAIRYHANDYSSAQYFFQQAANVEPNNTTFQTSLAHSYKDNKEADRAWDICTKVLRMDNSSADLFYLAGNLMTDIGDLQQAMPYYQKAMSLAPKNAGIHDTYLFCLLHDEQASAKDIYQAHQAYAKQHLPVNQTQKTTTSPHSRLRIGYLSGDFFTHSVSYFMQGIFQHHDREKFEIHGYYFGQNQDPMTETLKGFCEYWRDIHQYNDAQIISLIKQNEIDILIDLGGYTGQHKMAVMTQKPALIQVSYLGYPATTGLNSIDYRFTDTLADPITPAVDNTHSETLIRLPHGFLAYRPPPLPPIKHQLSDTDITFGCFNKLIKLSPSLLKLWVKILQKTAHAQLFLKSPMLDSNLAKKRLMHTFQQHGIQRERIKLLTWSESQEDHFKHYNHVDIALDSFPYHGTTTTCEALAMSTPVISLIGDRHASRVGLSLLHRVGLDELVAHTEEEYINIACQLAQQPEKIALYKKNIRLQLLASPLCNPQLITQDIEKSYQTMWLDHIHKIQNNAS